MRYWWVNQNHAFKQELGGGYLWSPKRNANGARNGILDSHSSPKVSPRKQSPCWRRRFLFLIAVQALLECW
jgi:hypothetical protein